MDINIDNLKKFLDRVKTIGFWGRLFSWKSIKQQLVDAVADLQKLITNADNLKEQNSKLESSIFGINKDLQFANETLTKNKGEIEKLNESNKNLSGENKRISEEAVSNSETITNLSNRKTEFGVELERLKRDLNHIQSERDALKQQNTQLLTDEENRKKDYERNVANVNSIREQIQNDRNKEIEDKNNKEIEQIRKLKETWSNHQENVKIAIKTICSRHTIEYVDKVPFKGEPDNTLKICDEFVILDAKSPGGDDLTNFPNYLKDQAERAKKYINEDEVKKDVFFVVPSNTLESLQQFVFHLSDYTVFIISLDSLEPIILSLQKIEEYEFAEKLSPEERDSICRILGKFGHLIKRRMQIDIFFLKQCMELHYKSENDLPKDILEKATEFERAEKLNPPIEKRAKQISMKELQEDTTKLINETNNKGISMKEDFISTELNKLPLYNDEADDTSPNNSLR